MRSSESQPTLFRVARGSTAQSRRAHNDGDAQCDEEHRPQRFHNSPARRGGSARTQTNYDIRYYIHRFSTRTVLFWYYNYEALGIRIPMHQVRYLRHFDLDLYDYCCGSVDHT